MQIIHEDPKEGKVKVKAETLDDLWHLYHIIDEGDVVYAKTLRKQSQRSDSLRAEKVEVIPVFLGVRAEKINFHKFANQVRVTGPIVYASREDVPLGKYHTIAIEEGTVVTIQKPRWKEHHIERLREAVSASKRARVMIVVIDDGEADMALVREYGVEILTSIRHNLGGKRYNTDREAEEKRFFHDVAKTMEEIMNREKVEKAIVAGPGFVKEDFYKFLRENYPELVKKVVIEDTSVTGRTGIYEVIKRGTVDRVYHENRVAKEVQLIEKVLENIAKNNGLVAYGLREVEEAANYGAVETLLVLDELLKGEMREKIEELMDAVRYSRGEVVIVSSEHEGGEKLKALGGLAALLRFRVK
ncbi:cell division protein [Thermococcus onnurineus NA1]|uniref:Protein pelota homolog n=1 Tax=Thermococcus onnurineus (strain NA1) TaxID=523850 RepID=PELO_THEON|nr:mRNA surveillance protein pelota [Thermococcus onnurineus]B6YUV3.1 RecName: Full=Protein pelota homolog [Thermococcus onnurineus NA1]NJE47379.1 mRNA surveillance protein pelota [Thermococcus sp. GR7]NJE78874.1 mRNA surveillance protein pelota [Thermococcus sp. GR4]NJF23131.1 mRNA surveillance protein pelota [Thermococcus sp. GR5]ACJ16139.1 cell division protein [Thermococcus onnurineus NA1]